MKYNSEARYHWKMLLRADNLQQKLEYNATTFDYKNGDDKNIRLIQFCNTNFRSWRIFVV